MTLRPLVFCTALLLAGCGGTASDDVNGGDATETAAPAGEAAATDGEAASASAAGDSGAQAAGPEGSAATEPAAAETTASATSAPATPAQPPLAFNQCRSCHSMDAGKNGVGPSLHGVFGRKAASATGFNYSPALAGKDITWDRASLDTWLTAPAKMAPGTRMVIGVPNKEARAAIIDYLAAQ